MFYKSSTCPICPKCWSGYYRKEVQADFPAKLGAPALRALLNEKITSLKALTKFTEANILALHGMGPKAVHMLKLALKKRSLSFKK